MARFHTETNQVIRAAPEKVFTAYSDVESHTKWDKTLRSCRVVKREGNGDWCEVEVKALGFHQKGTAKHAYFPASRVDYEFEMKGGNGKGSLIFEAVPEGTRLVNVGDMDVKGNG